MKTAKRNQQIESLRGLAILFVVLYHLVYRYCIIYQNGSKVNGNSLFISRWGQTGVLIFLVISVWYLYPDKIKKVNIIEEWKYRYIKLWPDYVLCITITYILSISTKLLAGRTVDLKTYLINITMLEGFLPDIDYVDGAHWYLTTLLLVTFWILFIDKILNRNRYSYIIWLILCTLASVLPEPFNYIGKFLEAEYVGVVTFVIGIKKIYYSNTHNIWNDNLAELITVLFSIIYMAKSKDFTYVCIMLFTLAVFLLCYKEKLNYIETPFLLFTGKISYPLYLIHQNISYMVENYFTNFFGQYKLIYMVPAFIISYFIAFVIYSIMQRGKKMCINCKRYI